MSHSTERGHLCGLILLKPWPHHSSLDKTLQENSAFAILKIASTMVGAGLTPSGLSWNPVKITFGGLNLYLAGFCFSSTCCIRSRKLWRFSSWSFSASSCGVPHPYVRTRSAMLQRPFSPARASYYFFLIFLVSVARLARVDVTTSTYQ